jgi:hypothetical protein
MLELQQDVWLNNNDVEMEKFKQLTEKNVTELIYVVLDVKR